MFSLICTWIDGWVNNHEAGGLRRHRAHYDVIVMIHSYDNEYIRKDNSFRVYPNIFTRWKDNSYIILLGQKHFSLFLFWLMTRPERIKHSDTKYA